MSVVAVTCCSKSIIFYSTSIISVVNLDLFFLFALRICMNNDNSMHYRYAAVQFQMAFNYLRSSFMPPSASAIVIRTHTLARQAEWSTLRVTLQQQSVVSFGSTVEPV